MTTLASRIQERANLFISEQAKLQSLQDDLLLAVSVEQSETARTKVIRRTLLEVSHDRFGIERKISDLYGEIDECDRFNVSLQSDAQRLQEAALVTFRKMEEDIEEFYAPHESNISIYSEALDSVILHRKRKLADDQEQDEDLRARTELLRIEVEQFCKETMQLEAEINHLKEKETQRDMNITSLASKVRESLLQRVLLRHSLNGSPHRSSSE